MFLTYCNDWLNPYWVLCGSYPYTTDTILVWEMNDEIERITENTIHVFNPAIQDLESGKLELPRPPMGAFSADGGFIEFFTGECICGQTDQMELGFDMGEL